MTSKSRNFINLSRRQLDAKLPRARDIQALIPENSSWVKIIRSALGMSAAQLARRMGITRQGVADLERREKEGSVSVGNLREAAKSLNCDLIVAFVPRESLETFVRRQAETKARDERNRIAHTMKLENQQEGVDSAIDTDAAVRAWLDERSKKLWD